MSKRKCYLGFMAFFFSGICAISTGVIVSILQELYGFDYDMTGLLLSCMNIGNLVASFLAGVLPSKIGTRQTVLLLCSGYTMGYCLMAAAGTLSAAAFAGLTVQLLSIALVCAFFLVGLSKGCALNNCTVIVSANSADTTKGMNVLHACYACGALLGPILISIAACAGRKAPMWVLALTGFFMWCIFAALRLPGREEGDSEAVGDQEEAPQKIRTAHKFEKRQNSRWSFLRDRTFWLLTGLIFCQNAAETSVTGWLVTFYKNMQILSGSVSNYTVTIMWGATLVARLLIAFVLPIRNRFRALSVMGAGCSIFYGVLVFTDSAVPALFFLALFSLSMAGVNPTAVAGAKQMSRQSMGIMLPTAGLGAVIMPWLIGIVAQQVSLRAGMLVNILPCAGIMVFSILCARSACE